MNSSAGISRRAAVTGLALAVLLPLSAPITSAMATPAAPDQQGGSGLPVADGNALRMWYTKPVANWESQALVQGNGSTGLMAYGAPSKERLHFNDKTLWRGGPGSVANYIGGNRTVGVSGADLESYRKQLDDRSTNTFGLPPSESNGKLTGLMFGNTGGMGMYQDFGDLYLNFADGGIADAATTNYVRDLDLRTGIASVNFEHGGVKYKREYFVSHPDQVAVVRLTVSEPGKLSFFANTAQDGGLKDNYQVSDAATGRLTLTSKVSDNNLKAEMQLRLTNRGGTLVSDGANLRVKNADEVFIVMTTGTNYANSYPSYRGEDPHERLTKRVDDAQALGFETLRQRHIADHQGLFDRVAFNVGGTVPPVPTDQLMKEYRAGKHDLAVDQLAYQFGRYLSIAGSRTGDLPTNLVGLWLVGGAGAFWGGDYHFNVNVQMNYWPAMSTNLAETQVPFNEFVESLVVPGRLTAERSAGVKTENFATTAVGAGNGFLINTQVNTFGHTAPIGSQEYGWNIGGTSWALQNVYDYYLFTGDTNYLQDHAYPMLKETAKFWNQYLWWSDYQQRLTVAPGVSAEQGPTAIGTTYDQSIVWELYRMAIEASETLGVDEGLREEWAAKQAQLDPILIGEQGQVKEWFEETTLGRAKAGDLPDSGIWNFGAGGSANQGAVHRHTSQLVGLFPGTLINRNTPEWMTAAIKSLEQRGLQGTGWAKAMKINMYARTGLAEDTYHMVNAMLAGNTNGLMDNLLGSHPPFQIDANFGLTAGMTEMLVQSHAGGIDVLPALPKAWEEGSFKGLRARGGYTVDATWKAGMVSEVGIVADRAGDAVVRNSAFSGKVRVYRENGKPANFTTRDEQVTISAAAGERYSIVPQFIVSLDAQKEPIDLRAGVPVSIAFTAADHFQAPAVAVTLDVPERWTVTPGSQKIKPLRPGQSATVEFTVHAPAGVPDGSYRVAGKVSSGGWSVSSGTALLVARPNLALGKAAQQISTDHGGVAARAVDGSTNGNFPSGSVTHTSEPAAQAWWEVDLGESQELGRVDIWNRTDCCANRLSNYYVMVSEQPFASGSLSETLAQAGVVSYLQTTTAGTPSQIPVDATGRYVRIQLKSEVNPLSLAEVRVFGK